MLCLEEREDGCEWGFGYELTLLKEQSHYNILCLCIFEGYYHEMILTL